MTIKEQLTKIECLDGFLEDYFGEKGAESSIIQGPSKNGMGGRKTGDGVLEKGVEAKIGRDGKEGGAEGFADGKQVETKEKEGAG